MLAAAARSRLQEPKSGPARFRVQLRVPQGAERGVRASRESAVQPVDQAARAAVAQMSHTLLTAAPPAAATVYKSFPPLAGFSPVRKSSGKGCAINMTSGSGAGRAMPRKRAGGRRKQPDGIERRPMLAGVQKIFALSKMRAVARG